MENKETEAAEILKRIENGTASDDDLIRYNYLCNLLQEGGVKESDIPASFNLEKDRYFYELANRTFAKKKSNVRRMRSAAAIAACLLTACLAAYWYFQDQSPLQKPIAVTSNPVAAPSVQDGAVLLLDDGSQISLKEQQKGLIAHVNEAEISKSSDSSLVYSTAGKEAVVRHHTLLTAKGHQYQLTLADGTKVWMNASSSLRYPVSFSGQSMRKVYLEGEAYFEVAKNADVPFIVETEREEIKVLGTHFNVNSYRGATKSTTTLLEGLVMVNGTTKLLPNEQLIISGKREQKRRVNAQDAIAWKKGYFQFEGATIIEIMDELSRWYDFQVQFNGVIDDEKIDISISRKRSLKDILNLLEATGNIKLIQNGKMITVKIINKP
ncbi:MAG: FecR family protein [Sphingobacterium sp.]